MEEYIQNIWLFLCLERQKNQLLVGLFVNQPFFVGKMILQVLRLYQRTSDNQYEHSYIYILKPFNEMLSSGLRNVS